MRTFIPKGIDAIYTDDEFANLENYSRRRGIYQYQFRVRIDQVRAIKLNATKLRITLKHINRKKRRRTFGDGNLSPEAAIDALLIDRASTKDSIRAKRRNIILRRRMDITGRLNNEIVRYVKQFSEEDARTLLPTRYTFVFKTAEEIREEGIETSFNNAGFRTEIYGDVMQLDPATAAIDSINKLHVDPAKSVMSREKVITQDNSLFGTIPAAKTEADFYRSRVIRTLRRDLTTVSGGLTLNDLPDDELIPVRVKEHKRFITVKRRFNLSRKTLKNKNAFNVVLELLDREGAIVQRETVKVDHRDLVRDYNIPRRAPLIRCTSSKIGVNYIEVAQRDKRADGIRLYKRVVNDSDVLMNSSYKLVGYYRLRKRGRGRRSRFIRIADRGPNSNPCIYRVVPTRGRTSFPIFKSIVVPPTTLPREFLVTKNKFSAVNLRSTEQGVEIEVRNFDQNASFIAITRKDLSSRERDFRLLSHELLGDGSAWRTITGDTMTFVDSTVQDERAYEYQAKLMYRDGTESLLIGRNYIEHMDLTDEVSFTVSTPRVRSDSRKANCTFKILVNLETENGNTNQTEILNDFINGSNSKNYFSSPAQTQELRDDSRKIVVFTIERQNLTTGSKVLFNVFNPAAGATFDDARMSRSSNIKERMKPGNNYRYIVRAHKVSPGDLFKHAAMTKIDRRTGRQFKVKTAKFLSRKAIRRGMLLPRKSKFRSTGKTAAFEAGKTGSAKTVTVDFSNSLPRIRRASVEKISDLENVLSWQVSGDPSKVDHFIIMIERLRTKIPVFTAQSFPGQVKYEYIDTFTPRMRGPVEFKIIPVFLDFTRGEEESMGGILSTGIAAKRRRQRRRRG